MSSPAEDEDSQPRQGELGEDVEIRGLRLDENDLRHDHLPAGPLLLFAVRQDQCDTRDERNSADDRGQRDGLLL